MSLVLAVREHFLARPRPAVPAPVEPDPPLYVPDWTETSDAPAWFAEFIRAGLHARGWRDCDRADRLAAHLAEVLMGLPRRHATELLLQLPATDRPALTTQPQPALPGGTR